MAKNYTSEQVADMTMNDDIGEMDSADSLEGNQVLLVPTMSYLLNPKLIVVAILTLSFMVDKSLSKNILLETII